MDIDKQILSDITVHMKYARHIKEKNRRETWDEIVDRNVSMHIKRYPWMKDDITSIYDNYVRTKKVLPSMRSLQFGGKAIEVNNSRIYNCAYMPVDSIYAFSETIFLLLGGTGVGYSVQNRHIDKLPEIRKPNQNRKKKYVVQDSIIGWADAVKTLMKAYTGKVTSTPVFDFSDIREKGALLVTAGGKAPGPDPLRIALLKIESILNGKNDGDKLTDIECHDIQCHLADAVLAGGIRRAAMICLFDLDSDDMISCKSGNWWETNPQRGRANNSAVLLRHKIDKKEFMKLWDRIHASGSGEPGMYFTNDNDWGTNPCCLSYDTNILTSEGYRKIGDLDELTLDFINYKGEKVKGTVFKSGTKELFDIKLSNGKTIRSTEDHRFMMVDGSDVMVKNMSKGDSIMSFFSENNRIGLFALFGYIQGDGCTSRLLSDIHKGIEIHIGKNDQDVADEFSITSKYVSGYNDRLIELGFSAKSLPERTLPSTINYWNKDDIAMFLKGLFSANGCVIKGQRVALKSTCIELITHVKSILFNVFGIESYYTTNRSKNVKFHNGVYTCKESYDLNISRLDSVIAFAENISFIHSYKKEDLKNLIRLKSPKIVSIKPSGVEDVYDFSLFDDTHWGVVDGVIAHNCEIALRPNQFCNLVEINMGDVDSQEEFEKRSRAAAFIATLQASYTDFHYLRDIWRKNTEKDALIGVSMTGIASEGNMKLDFNEASMIVKEENKRVADLIGINPAARSTAVKPAGTTSLVLGTSSGIHAWHNDYYIRRIRVGKNEALYSYLSINHPELVEDEYFSPNTQAVISVPQKAPIGAITRHESVFDLLNRVKTISENWVKTGHTKGSNTHNVSCTVSIKEDEWDAVGEWMWQNRESYNGLSVLPMDGGTYKQTPFEDCTEETYNTMMKALRDVDLSMVIEMSDNTNLTDQAACAGGSCEIK